MYNIIQNEYRITDKTKPSSIVKFGGSADYKPSLVHYYC